MVVRDCVVGRLESKESRIGLEWGVVKLLVHDVLVVTAGTPTDCGIVEV